jgi:exodeoxyribonuclease VII large subunit
MLARHLALLNPAVRISRQQERCAVLTQRLSAWWELSRRRRHERLGLLAGKLESLSPLGILGRGYSICFALPGRTILTRAADAAAGSEVAVRLHEGELQCVVRRADATPDGA